MHHDTNKQIIKQEYGLHSQMFFDLYLFCGLTCVTVADLQTHSLEKHLIERRNAGVPLKAVTTKLKRISCLKDTEKKDIILKVQLASPERNKATAKDGGKKRENGDITE